MRSAQIVQKGVAEVHDVAPPELTPGCALVRPLFVGVNGRDTTRVYQGDEADYPLPSGSSGSEVVGVVEAVDYVGGKALPFTVDEVAIVRLPDQAGMAELLQVPLANLIHQTIETDPFQVVLSHQLGDVLMACERLRGVTGLTVAVVGQGGAGLMFDSVLRRMGARDVIGLDPVAARREAARGYGSTHVLDPSDPEVVEQVGAISPRGMPDVVIDAAGSVAAINLAVMLVAKGGRFVPFGEPPARVFPFEYETLRERECQVVSCTSTGYELEGYHAYRLALNAVARDDFGLRELITHRRRLEEVTEAYRLSRSGDDAALKVVVDLT